MTSEKLVSVANLCAPSVARQIGFDEATLRDLAAANAFVHDETPAQGARRLASDVLDTMVATFVPPLAIWPDVITAESPSTRTGPVPLLGEILAVERRGDALYGDVRWASASPPLLAFGLSVAFTRDVDAAGTKRGWRILYAYPRREPREESR